MLPQVPRALPWANGSLPFQSACCGGLKAQTHADATSQKWKGIDVNTVLGNSDYTDNGFPFLLYNVGTGRFIMQGGDWAMEGRLFFSDFGRKMYLYSNGRINAGITESQMLIRIVSAPDLLNHLVKPGGANYEPQPYYLMDGDKRGVIQ